MWKIFIKLSIYFKNKSHFILFSTCMHNVLWDIHTISPVLHKLCKLVPVSRPVSQWGIWIHAITWYCCHILTAEPHFDSDRKNTQSISTLLVQHIYLQKMANELSSIRTYVSLAPSQIITPKWMKMCQNVYLTENCMVYNRLHPRLKKVTELSRLYWIKVSSLAIDFISDADHWWIQGRYKISEM